MRIFKSKFHLTERYKPFMTLRSNQLLFVKQLLCVRHSLISKADANLVNKDYCLHYRRGNRRRDELRILPNPRCSENN